jgi:HemY protein
MIRVVLFLLVVGALSFGVAWFADRPGDVMITWQGLRIETSLMVLGGAVLVLMAVLAFLWWLISVVLRSPGIVARMRRERRGARAYEAISNGLIAVGSGDATAARLHSNAVNRIAAGEPLALLLAAQSAQLSGDRGAAENTFRAMASRADTKTLGLHGLYVEAQRRNDLTSARAYAEEAARTAPALGWASRAVQEFRCAVGDWAGALAHLERTKSTINKDTYRRQRAVMLTAHAQALEDIDRDQAKSKAIEAAKLAPSLVPAAATAGRMLAEGGELRKASRVVAKAWRANPHPDLAQTYADLRFGDAARDRLARIEALVKKTPGQIEGALAVARAALDAREFKKARTALAPYLTAITRRVALMMAELERAEHNDEGRAREWLGRALNAAPDPQWTADGHVSDRWQPVSPVTGRLDAFEWRVPLTGIVAAPVIEPLPPSASVSPPEPVTVQAVPAPAEITQPPAPREKVAQPGGAAPSAQQPGPLPAWLSARTQSTSSPRKAPAVIPLVHAPDDPGPEASDDAEKPAEPQTSGWRKIFE